MVHPLFALTFMLLTTARFSPSTRRSFSLFHCSIVWKLEVLSPSYMCTIYNSQTSDNTQDLYLCIYICNGSPAVDIYAVGLINSLTPSLTRPQHHETNVCVL